MDEAAPGVYTATVPGQAAGALVQLFVEAEDAGGATSAVTGRAMLTRQFYPAGMLTVSVRRAHNLARLAAALVARFSLTLAAVVKPLDCARPSARAALFLRTLLTGLLLAAPGDEGALAAAFTRLGDGEDRLATRDAVALALHTLVTPEAPWGAAEAARPSGGAAGRAPPAAAAQV
jgi:hypothetical protein